MNDMDIHDWFCTGDSCECQKPAVKARKPKPVAPPPVKAVVPKKVVALDLTSWVGTCAIGAEHYYGKLKQEWGDYDTQKRIKLQHPLTAEEARLLNRKNKHLAYWFTIVAGTLNDQFATPEDVRAFAIKVWKKEFPEGDILVSDDNLCQPSEPIDGDPKLVKAASEIWKKWQPMWDDGGWETKRYEKAMNRLCGQWYKLLGLPYKNRK